MSISERLMKPGSFEISFVEDTPYSVRSVFVEAPSIYTTATFGFLGHVFVTPTRLGPAMQDLTTLLASARYTGVMTRRLRRGIAGDGLLYYFGNGRGIGHMFSAHLRLTQGFSAWINDIVNDEPAGYLSPYDVGTITNIGASTLEFDPFGLTRREALDKVCEAFAGEYRLNPDNTFDAGTAANLFVTNPTRVILPRGGPIDISLEGLRALALDAEVDYDDMSAAIFALLEGDTPFYDPILSGNPLAPDDLNSNNGPGGMAKRVDAGGNISYSEHGVPLLGFRPSDIVGPRRALSIDLAGYDVAGDVAVGDTIAIYDPLNLLFDTSNPTNYGGTVIYPIELRVYAMTWPLQQGMGVYYRQSQTGVVTDLTDYIAWESGGAQLEVGAVGRKITADISAAAPPEILARVFDTPCARVTNSVNQLIPNATDYTLEFDTESGSNNFYDSVGMHDTSAPLRHRFTIQSPGVYRFKALIEFDTNATGFRHVQILLNGTDIIAAETHAASPAGATRISCGDERYFVEGDYIEVVVHQTSGGNLNVLASNYYSPIFSISKVAPPPA